MRDSALFAAPSQPPPAAGLSRRLGARLIDAVVAVVLAIVFTIAGIFGLFWFGSDLGISDGTLATLGDLVLFLVLFSVLFGPFVVSVLVGLASGLLGKGAGITPGRRTFGLQVVDADDGEPSRGRAALHAILRDLPALLLFFGVVAVPFDGDPMPLLFVLGGALLLADAIAPLARRDDRALHDVLAGVTVVRKERATVTVPAARA